LAASPSGGQQGPSGGAPAGAGDVFVCDFEDRFDKDYDAWPDGWTRRRSRELPEFLRVEIVKESEENSNRCLQLALDGGGAVVASPTSAISSQFSLQVSLRVKTAGLVHDGAWAELTLLDIQGQVVERHGSPPLVKTAGWQTVKIGPIAAINNQAVRAVVSLHLAPLGKREDLTGKAWFDDVRMVRLPRMTLLASGSATGVYSNRESAALVCEVSGICVPNPQVRFELFDHTGKKIEEHAASLLSEKEIAKTTVGALPKDGYAGHANWSPRLPDFGFYRVRASLFEKGQDTIVLDRTQSLAVLRPLAAPVRGEFGWSLTGDERPYAFGPMTTLLSQAALGWAKMPVWYDSRDTSHADRIAWFAEQLSIQGVELVGVLDQPPPELRDVFREQGKLVTATVFADPGLWQPAVAPVMTRLSLKVRWWQLGDDSDTSFIGYPGLDAKMLEIKKHLEQYGQQIYVGFNWRWGYLPPVPGPRGAPWSYLSYSTDPPLTSDEMAAYLQPAGGSAPPASQAREPTGGNPSTLSAEERAENSQVSSSSKVPPRPAVKREAAGAGRVMPVSRRSQGEPKRWILLPPLPRSEYVATVRVQDLVMRMLAAKIHRTDAVFVPQPFSDEEGIMNTDGSPGELFVPWRTTAALVGGSEYLGPLQLPGASSSHLFARNGRAVMAVWSDRPTTEYVFLGDEIEQIDVWGRGAAKGGGSKPPLVERDGRKLHELQIGTLPTFVIGMSEAAARWQTAVTFENMQLSSVAGRQQTIVLKLPNTLRQAVAGEMTLHAPKSWGYDARPVRFKVAEGEELRLPLLVTLMANTNSGPQAIRLDFDIGGDRFSVYRTLQLGLDDVQVEIASRLRSDGAVIVEQHLTNLSNRPLSFQCLLFAPGRRRETRQVINLGRDRTTLVFVLLNGEELIGKELWLRAEEIGGPRLLNYTLTAER
jgi:hypothetical protein